MSGILGHRGLLMAQEVASGDPHWANVVSLLHLDGANGGTTFTDQKGKTWSAAGNAQTTTSRFVFGGASLLLDGSGDYIGTGANADFAPGTGDFTNECWIYRTVTSAEQFVLCMRSYSGGRPGNILSLQNGYPAHSTGAVWLTSSIIAPLNEWCHVAVSRSSSVLKIFVNGVQGYSGTDTTNYSGTNRTFRIGANDDLATPAYFTGNIDDVRITKGVARYTSDFTPPTAPFPDF